MCGEAAPIPGRTGARRMRMPLRAPLGLILGLLPGLSVLAGCGQPDGFRETRAFAAAEALQRLPWTCHTAYSIVPDTLSGAPALEVEAFRGARPGMEWNWLAGDWRGYDSLCFRARMRDPASAEFALTIWDGEEPYDRANRFSARFPLGNRWTAHCLDLRAGLRARGGRPLRLGKVRRVMFFAASAEAPLAFRLEAVGLR